MIIFMTFESNQVLLDIKTMSIYDSLKTNA